MEIEELDDKISLKRRELSIEKDLMRRQNLRKQIRKLVLKKEIKYIQQKIEAIS